jgi:hypothetical protein
METITYSQVQELVRQLPETKLPLAYRLLKELADKDIETLSSQADFIRIFSFANKAYSLITSVAKKEQRAHLQEEIKRQKIRFYAFTDRCELVGADRRFVQR